MSQFRFAVVKFFEFATYINWSYLGDVCYADGSYAFDYGALSVVALGVRIIRREIDAYEFKEDAFRLRVQMMLSKPIDDYYAD